MAKYDAWSSFFASIEEDEVVISMKDLEAAIGASLPPSARRHAAWWGAAHHHAKWVEHGFVASPQFDKGTVRFRRGSSGGGRLRNELPWRVQDQTGGGDDRLILLGCVAQKRPLASPARNLYTSPLWEKRRGYADASGQPWAVLSAEHGLVMPDQILDPYDRALKHESPGYQREWSRQVAEDVIDLCRRLGLQTVEAHAGSDYLEHGLIAALNRAGIRVLWPLRGMRIGEQLAWYGEQPSESAIPSGDTSDVPSPTTPDPGEARAPWPRIVEMREVGPFEYRWPDSTEAFEYGWEGICRLDSSLVGFRHGVGGRVVYGRHRTHTVTWIGYDPAVEGVAADDYETSLSLLSLIKDANGAMVRDRDAVPPGYEALPIVDHRSEIDASYSRYGLAVKLRVDDMAGWLRHAQLRRGGSSRSAESPSTPGGFPSATALEHPERPEDLRLSPQERLSSDRKREVAEALVAFGETAAAQLIAEGGSVEFTEDAEANSLVKENSFAFLIGVISDQGIKAERAWAIPKELERRLGHLDPARIVAEPEAVYEAFVEPSALHRYVKTVPAWVISAADRVLTEYGGEAAAIWDGTPMAAELQARLRRFDGIGQKKAAMAVEILERDLGVPISGLHGSDIAYDVHIRRVFLRTGLAERDDLDHMVKMARSVYPERPGALDSPAWVVGRAWCRPGAPKCPACALRDVCPQRIEAGDGVRGA